MDRLDHGLGKTSFSRRPRKPDVSAASINQSLNASLHLNHTLADSLLLPCNVSVSFIGGGSQGSYKTPTQSPSRGTSGKLTPSHSFNRGNLGGGNFNSSKKLSRSFGNLSVNGNKTPNRTPSRGPDRFIPDRNVTNFDVSHYLLTANENVVDGDDDGGANYADNQGNIERGAVGGYTRKALTEALLGDISSFRIINCSQRTSNGRNNTIDITKSGKKASRRHIPSQPERILDAPEVMNDYYLQLIDWSSTDLLAVALNRDVYIWNSKNGDISNLMTVEDNDYVSSLSWIPGGNQLAIGTGNQALYLYDVDLSKKLRSLRGHPQRVSSLSWNEHILSAGCRSGDILHHDVRVGKHLVGSSKLHTHEVCGLKWSPTGQYLASGANDNQVFICNASCSGENNPTPIYHFNKHEAAVKAVGWCPWKPTLLATGGGSADKTLRIWNTCTGENTFTVDTKTQVSSLLWSLEHQELITGHGYDTNQLTIWKYPGLTRLQDLIGHSARILGTAMSPDGQTVVSLGADETLRFWECFQVDKSKKRHDQTSGKENLLSTLSIR